LPADDLALLIAAAREAGALARDLVTRPLDTVDKPGGAGPVTAVDLAVDALLSRRLRDARPGYGWLSEETEDDPARLAAGRVFIVDPIDGTRSLIEGSGLWAHALAVAETGGCRRCAGAFARRWPTASRWWPRGGLTPC
jgi:myo-inositol-1(or 4)-monophosphatase